MDFVIDGADATNGQDRSVTIAAGDKDEAVRKARARGVLASTVRPAVQRDTPEAVAEATAQLVPLDYQRPSNTLRTSPAPADQQLPEYRTLVDADRWLRGIAAVVGGIGWLLAAPAVASACGLVFVLIKGRGAAVAMLLATLAWTGALSVTCLLLDVLLRWLACVGLAVRDVARNSFTRAR